MVRRSKGLSAAGLAPLLLLFVAAGWEARTSREAVPPGPAAAREKGAQAEDLPRASTVVEPRAYVSLEPVPRGRRFDLAVVANIRPGFHINAHEASRDYLIPTTLEAQLPPGFRELGTLYPRGALHKFDFSPEKLTVYEGSVTLRMKLQALPDAPLGAAKLALTLRYQACSEDACLPQVKIPVTAEFEIAPADALARPAHPSIFQTPPRPKIPSPR